MAKEVAKFTEFYYYDGNSFQRCLVLDELTNSMIDNNVSGLISYAGRDGFSNLVTEDNIETKCFYKIENVPNLFHVRTPRGWELIMTESMDVKAKGLSFIDNVLIDVKPVLLVSVSESCDIEAYTFSELGTDEIVNPLVKAVPKVIHTDVYELSPVKLSDIGTNAETVISFLNNIDTVVSEVLDFKEINTGNLVTDSEVIITIS